MESKDIFEQMAHRYDTEERLRDSEIVASEIRKMLSDTGTQEKQALDYGCGTGQVGLKLLDLFRSITFVDESPQMIELVQRKIIVDGVTNASALCCDLVNEPLPDMQPDYILLSRVLIHVKEYLVLLERLYELLKPGGCMVIVDFDKNDKIDTDKVHHGFEQSRLRSNLGQIGFTTVDSHTFYQRKNMFVHQDASLFILAAKK